MEVEDKTMKTIGVRAGEAMQEYFNKEIIEMLYLEANTERRQAERRHKPTGEK